MNLKIWHKMIIGVTIPSVIVILGGLISYEYIKDVSNRQIYVQVADDLKEHLLEVRRNEKNFILHKDAEYYKYCSDAIIVFTNNVKNISPKIIDEIGKSDFFTLRKFTERYAGLISHLHEQYLDEANVIETVREEGRKLETLVAEGNLPEELSTDFVLNLRRLEKNYMLFRDIRSFEGLNSGLEKLKDETTSCTKCVPYINAVNDLFSSYQKSDGLVNGLQIVGNTLEEVTNRIAINERERISSFLIMTQRYLLFALVLLIIIGPFFIYTTANYIVAPIKRLAEITRKISEGDLSHRAPIKEHDETYELAISFNTMLDHLQLTHQSLEKSLDLLREKQEKLVEAEKLASLGTLASGVAHELNNPLNNIYLATQTLYNEIDLEKTPEIVKESVKDIFSQTLRVKRIVGDLLEFARGKGAEIRKINIVDLIRKVLKQMVATGEIKNVRYEINAKDLMEIPADILLLEQALINLFSNAIDAMDGNGSLNISVDLIDTSVIIKVSDTGKGIMPENIKKVFDPFFTTKEKGTGLGLAIVYSIIKKHKGEIDVKSEPGKGTTFSITLPC